MQQDQEDLEVQFCDLCGTSVPLADLERGAAMRHQAKTIGACCLMVLRQGDSPLITPGLPTANGGLPAADRSGADRSGADRSGDGAGAVRAGGEVRLMPVAFALLAAITAVTIYLDLRIGRIALLQDKNQQQLQESLQSGSEVLIGIDQAMDGTANKADVDGLRERLQKLDGVVQVQQEQARQQSEQLRQGLTTIQQDVAKLGAQAIDYRPLFDDLRVQVQRQSALIGDLRALSAAAPPPVEKPPSEPAVAVPTDPGLPVELAAQIKRLGDADAAVRFEAVDQLLVSKNLAVLPSLVPMTRDLDGFVRRLTVEGLRDFKHPTVVEALLESLADNDVTVAETAWSSLKKLTGQKIPFDAASPSKDTRARGQQRWREWWDKNKEAFGS